ncbi:hypothetical protein ITX44_13270 [Streptomyces sp. KK5PA1]|uniref:SAV-6107-like HEPN domain-containing protein n=1 Tax=Actinacidiphila acididurans TaxID=2784346 RepID=A0ABS2TQ90_9ACTN|nr:hypothetical protein [Actinacidiphila acididurans]
MAVPRVPSTPRVPTAPGVPGVHGITGVPGVPDFPGVTRAAGAPGGDRGDGGDVHPVLRRAAAAPAALDLLTQAHAGLAEAATLQTPNERYATAHLAALRTAAAVLAVRGRPEATARQRRRIRTAWEVLPEVAPELAEWSALFAAGAARRARAEAGIAGAAGPRDADDLIRATGMFLRLVERMLLVQPALESGAPQVPGPAASRVGAARS